MYSPVFLSVGIILLNISNLNLVAINLVDLFYNSYNPDSFIKLVLNFMFLFDFIYSFTLRLLKSFLLSIK